MALFQIWTIFGTLLCLVRANPHMMSEADMHQLNMINMPPGFSQKYLNFDPCLSSPCMFGRICKTIPEQEVSSGFVCLNEIDATKEISDARMVYRNMELLAKEAILLNVATIQNHGQPPLSSSQQQALLEQMMAQQQAGSGAHPQEQTVTMSFKGKKPVKMTCDQKPCQNDEICVSKPESIEGYICILQRITVVEDENNKIISKLLNDEKFMSESAARCQSSQESVHRRLEIPNLSTHFIACDDHEKSKFSIQSCPEGLLFNKFLDRCDLDQEPLTGGCSSSPCQFGGKCHDLTNLDYQCECPLGFSGKNCQQAPDVCATSPCGHSPGNICHVLPPESGLNFYCTCFSGKAFGLSCEEGKVERNPCEDGAKLGSVFSTRISPSVFGLCDEDHRLNLRVCDRQMQAMGKCKWLSGLASSRSRRGTRLAIRKPILKAKYE